MDMYISCGVGRFSYRSSLEFAVYNQSTKSQIENDIKQNQLLRFVLMLVYKYALRRVFGASYHSF